MITDPFHSDNFTAKFIATVFIDGTDSGKLASKIQTIYIETICEIFPT